MERFRVWDNGGKTFDRYTILDTKWGGIYGASDNPFHPQGFGQLSHETMLPETWARDWSKNPEETELRIEQLPEPVRQYIEQLSD